MKRAAVLIGVRQTGGLTRLPDATRAANRMAHWARNQGFATVKVLTDERRPLKIQRVQEAITEIVDIGATEQLLVYFAGHGVNNGMNEIWLLSGAPENTAAAVNVGGSVALARRCGIPHVVFISDACRTAAPSIQAQNVRGTDIFPNQRSSGPGKYVDQFFACAVGDPSFEVTDLGESTSVYRAVYTTAVLDGLGGTLPQLLEPDADDPNGMTYVIRPWRLKDYLDVAVAALLQRLQPGRLLVQTPDAQINSPGTMWLATHQLTPTEEEAFARRQLHAHRDTGRRPVARTETLQSLAQVVLSDALETGPSSPELVRLESAAILGRPAATTLQTAIASGSEQFGPDSFETHCGIKVRGSRISDAFCPDAFIGAPQPGKPVDVVRAALDEHRSEPAASVLLTFEDGSGGVFPVLLDFITALTLENGRLIDVRFEPAANTARRGAYDARREELEQLRAIVATAVRYGAFRLSGADAEQLARRMQVAKGVDPAMALYAAYAYDSMQRPDLVESMERYLLDDLGVRLFDVSLLSGELTKTAGDVPLLYPPAPMLAQGWALLRAQQVDLPVPLQDLQDHLVPSVWTLCDAEGTERLGTILGRPNVGNARLRPRSGSAGQERG